jgi:flagellar basal-body rod modification protein FlgD
MAAAAAGIFSQHLAAGQSLGGTKSAAMDSTTSGTSGTDSSTNASGDSSTISANDFLTLLVTEMQNQDPTADTDPNEYINQLVQVNSLEQLIDINQNLSTALGDAGSSGATGGTPDAVPGAAAGAAAANPTASAAQAKVSAHQKGTAVTAAQNGASSLGNSGTTTTASPLSGGKKSPGNLSIPDPLPAAQRVGHALNGKSHSRSIAGTQPGRDGRTFTRRP